MVTKPDVAKISDHDLLATELFRIKELNQPIETPREIRPWKNVLMKGLSNFLKNCDWEGKDLNDTSVLSVKKSFLCFTEIFSCKSDLSEQR